MDALQVSRRTIPHETAAAVCPRPAAGQSNLEQGTGIRPVREGRVFLPRAESVPVQTGVGIEAVGRAGVARSPPVRDAAGGGVRSMVRVGNASFADNASLKAVPSPRRAAGDAPTGLCLVLPQGAGQPTGRTCRRQPGPAPSGLPLGFPWARGAARIRTRCLDLQTPLCPSCWRLHGPACRLDRKGPRWHNIRGFPCERNAGR